MAIIISGSIAYDYIMDFPDVFKNHILPDQLHILNVSFLVDRMQKGLGGTAGNIAYTIKLLGGEPIMFSTIGKDGMEYFDHWKKMSMLVDHIIQDDKRLTSAAYIVTDKDDNQITAFYPGPADRSSELRLADVKEKPSCVMISPTDKNVMQKHLRESHDNGFVTIFDPGQQIFAFSGEELQQCVEQSNFIIGNDYEIKILSERTGWDTKQLLGEKRTLVVTLGEQGSVIHSSKETIKISAAKPRSVDDPTGAGDAFRAGFFMAYEKGFNLKTCGQFASVAGSFAVESYGTQQHRFTLDEFRGRYQSAYHTDCLF